MLSKWRCNSCKSLLLSPCEHRRSTKVSRIGGASSSPTRLVHHMEVVEERVDTAPPKRISQQPLRGLVGLPAPRRELRSLQSPQSGLRPRTPFSSPQHLLDARARRGSG